MASWRWNGKTRQVELRQDGVVLWCGTATEHVRLMYQGREVANQACAAESITLPDDSQWSEEDIIELGPNSIEIEARVIDDAEADLPHVVRFADGSARVDLSFGE